MPPKTGRYVIDLGNGERITADVTEESLERAARVKAAMDAGKPPDIEDVRWLMRWSADQD